MNTRNFFQLYTFLCMKKKTFWGRERLNLKILLKVALVVFVIPMILVLSEPLHKAQAQSKLSVYVDGFPLPFAVEPRIVTAKDGGGHTVVPFRTLAESLGVKVDWENETRTVVAQGYGKIVRLPIGQDQASVDDTAYDLDVAPFIDQGHTLIPLRFFSEIFGAKVSWNQEHYQIDIQSPARGMYTFSFYGLGSFEYRHYVPYFDGIAYTWSCINRQGEFITSNNDNGTYNEFFWPQPHPDASTEDIIASGQENNGQAFLTVAAFENRGEVSALLLNPEKKAKAIQDMMTLITEKKMDGILIDFEGIRNTEEHASLKAAFTQFIRELSAEAKEKQVQVGVALPPPNNYYNGYEYQQLGEIADFIFLMAYDYHPRGENQDHWLPEPMVAVNQGLELTLEHIPMEKLLLGINVLYETPETTVEKMGLAKRYSLKGVGFWLLKGLDTERLDLIHNSIPFPNRERKGYFLLFQ